jgi:hypothetical protein
LTADRSLAVSGHTHHDQLRRADLQRSAGPKRSGNNFKPPLLHQMQKLERRPGRFLLTDFPHFCTVETLVFSSLANKAWLTRVVSRICLICSGCKGSMGGRHS